MDSFWEMIVNGILVFVLGVIRPLMPNHQMIGLASQLVGNGRIMIDMAWYIMTSMDVSFFFIWIGFRTLVFAIFSGINVWKFIKSLIPMA